jgi:hypothetical protein
VLRDGAQVAQGAQAVLLDGGVQVAQGVLLDADQVSQGGVLWDDEAGGDEAAARRRREGGGARRREDVLQQKSVNWSEVEDEGKIVISHTSSLLKSEK